jgi:hypothetical protein
MSRPRLFRAYKVALEKKRQLFFALADVPAAQRADSLRAFGKAFDRLERIRARLGF